MTISHHYQDIIDLFAQTFTEEYQTIVVSGDDEPVYLPADQDNPYHRIIFAHGFYASALHEISHWCVAGRERHKLVDFGYWYCPDGRSRDQQAQFEAVEICPQAYEWLFCVAAGFSFNVSCDNLQGDFQPDRIAFQRKVQQYVLMLLQQGIPARPAKFIAALQDFYGTSPLKPEDFPYPEYPIDSVC